jgi:hypothetical protein
MWQYQGHISIHCGKLGFILNNTSTIYNGFDIGEVDPEYRLYLLGYSIAHKKIQKIYPRQGYIYTLLKHLLKGKCYCCLKLSQAEICTTCEFEFHKCSVNPV